MTEPAKPLNIRRRIQVRGIVQGVGFRPFVYKLAKSLGLSGYVFNSSAGVTIEIEGSGAQVEDFLRTLKEDPPQLAEIAEVAVSEIAVEGGADSLFSVAGRRPVHSHSFLRTQAPARLAGKILATLRTGATATPSPIAPTAVRATRSSVTFPTIARPRPCHPSKCVAPARLSTKIRKIAGFMPSRTPVRPADHLCCW